MLKACSLTFPALLISILISAQNKIRIDEASKHVGEMVTICDRISEGKFVKDSKTEPTLLELGSSFPKQKITVVINYNDRKNFSDRPEVYYVDKDVCITGRVTEVKGKPVIVISKPADIQIGAE